MLLEEHPGPLHAGHAKERDDRLPTADRVFLPELGEGRDRGIAPPGERGKVAGSGEAPHPIAPGRRERADPRADAAVGATRQAREELAELV